MRILNIVFIILFVFSAAVQFNDPDPYIWIPLYLYGAFICYLALRKKFLTPMYVFGLLIYVSYAVYLFFEKDGVLSWWNKHNAENIAQSMKATRPWIEATREFFGLILLIIALVINLLWKKKNHPLQATLQQTDQ